MADARTSGTAIGSSPAEVQATGTGGFARRSSGLVRDFSQVDNWIYNVLAINVVVYGALTFATLAVTYPRANMWLSFLIAGFFCSFLAVGYALLTSAMPRSGGDYVFQSRILGGGVASVFAFSAITLAQLFVAGIAGFTLANVILSPFFLLLGAQYDAGWMTDVGTFLVKKEGVFICALAVVVWSATVNVRGLRFYARIQRSAFWVGLGLLAMFILVLLFTSHAGFVNNFNSYVDSNYGVKNAYAATIKAGGTVDTSFSFKDTILASVIAAFALIYPAYSCQQAGEIKRANSVKGNLRAMLGAELFSAIALALIAALLVSRVGSDFLYASGTLFFSGAENNPLPVPPFLGFLFAVAGNAAIFVWLSLAMFICWVLLFFPNATLGATRNMLAMSFDGVLPAAVGQVDRRTHVPLKAILVFAILSVPPAALYVFASDFSAYTLGFFIVSITAFAVTMVAALLFPWRKPDLYAQSPASNYTVLGLPLISVSAGIFLLFAIFVDVQALRADELGINGTKGLVFIGGIWLVAVAIYWTAKLYRRRENVDLGLAYRELPVE